MTVPLQRAYIGLGANLGDAQAALEAACAALGALPHTHWVARSGWYRSAPVDSSGPDYLNGAAAIDTALAPLALLDALLAIEAAHGRERPYRNAPRTLDLDLLLYGDWVLDTPRLTLPHPRAHLRAFVLRPMAELLPEGDWPGQGPLVDLLACVADQRVERLGG
ncbi:MAG TPA: 2-amino-4-hydroxy-6-hydroxymethyldihydropteridine diphosphokinase [Burkholderiaceae bacterium]|nr:2-amino-4-hydroxy-6-hydroxymethyldihydropteridine diphosphokinase [Burkholderiaceae bacterium]